MKNNVRLQVFSDWVGPSWALADVGTSATNYVGSVPLATVAFTRAATEPVLFYCRANDTFHSMPHKTLKPNAV